ncbi:MAG: glycerate kinase, partial [Streptococcaceae bacterium]|nr:glycerate kinase [Streptococcaceae bacterium]
TSGQIAAQNESALAFAAKMKTERGIDLQKIPGTGAAGGLGGAIALLGGKIVPGFPKIAEILGIESAIADADLVLTGEGRMDFQTANGKVPAGMARLAEKHGVPTIALCGALADDLGEMDKLLLASFSIQRSALPLEEAMEKTRTLENMRRLSRNVVRVFPQK